MDRYHLARKNALNFRDKKLVRELSKLEKEYDEKLDKLEKKTDKTMNSKKNGYRLEKSTKNYSIKSRNIFLNSLEIIFLIKYFPFSFYI